MEVSASHIHARYPTHATQDPPHVHIRYVYGTFTLSGAPFQDDFYFPDLGYRCPYSTSLRGFPRRFGLSYSVFIRHYSRNYLLISFPPPTEMLQFGGFPFLITRNDCCQEVQFGNSRIKEIHASPRDLSQLVTTFFGSRAEPSPNRVVASYFLLYSLM